MGYKALCFAASLFAAVVVAGQFQEKSAWNVSVRQPQFCVIGDLNGDKFGDAVITSFDRAGQGKENALLVFDGANGTLSDTPRSATRAPNVYGTAIYDFDRDGKNDIAAVRYHDTLMVFLAKDAFDAGKALEFRCGSQRALTIAIARTDDKNYLYALYAGTTGRLFRFIDEPVGAIERVFNKIGEKKYLYAQNLYASGPEKNDNAVLRTLVPADLDADGAMDLIATDIDGQFIRVYQGPFSLAGSPRIAARLNPKNVRAFFQTRTPEALYRDTSLVVGDFNDDGFPDIAATSSTKTFIYLQPDPEGFANGFAPTAIIDFGGRCYVEDLNADGVSDLVVLNDIGGRTGNVIAVFLGKKGRDFSSGLKGADQILKLPPVYNLALGDVNGDKRADLLAVEGLGWVRLYLAKSDEKEKARE